MQIRVESLSHIYEEGMPFETVALENINFTIESGSLTGVIGHTGSGKSTLMMHISGLIKPSRGRVYAGGTEIGLKTKESREAARKIGIVFQYPEYQLFEESVLKDVSFGPKNFGFSPQECEEKAKKALELVGIDPDEKGRFSPFELSGGEKRRVAIAGVLATEPEVLILDEPTAGLDPMGHREILKIIEQIRKLHKPTILLVSHNMDDIAAMADQVLVIDGGRLAMEGTPAEVFARREELASMGLGLPSASSLLSALKDRGMELRADIFDEGEAAREIARALRQD